MHEPNRSSSCSDFDIAINSLSFDNISPPDSPRTEQSSPKRRPSVNWYREHRSGKRFRRHSLIGFLTRTHSLPALIPTGSQPTPNSDIQTEITSQKDQPTEKMPANYEKVVKLTAQMVPLFSGEMNPQLLSELQTFIGCCKQVQQCLEEEEKRAFMQIFPTRLRGNAYQLIASSLLTNFEEVEQLLYRTYLPRETYHELINKLITCRQYPQESFNSFTTRLKGLLLQCNEAAQTKYGAENFNVVKQQIEDFAIASVKSGATNLHLSSYLLTLNENSLDSLIQKALDMERLHQGLFYIPQPTHYIPHPTSYFPTNNFSGHNTINHSTAYGYPSHESVSFTQYPYTNELVKPNIKTEMSIPPTSEPSRLASVSFNTDGGSQNNWCSNQTSFTRKPLGSPPPCQNSSSQHLDRKPYEEQKLMLGRIICSYCKYRGHTYDECIKRKNTPFCINCRARGHDAQSCKQNAKAPREHSNNNNNAQWGTPNRTPNPRINHVQEMCNFCGRRSHTESTCRLRQRWEFANSGNCKLSTEKSPARH